MDHSNEALKSIAPHYDFSSAQFLADARAASGAAASCAQDEPIVYRSIAIDDSYGGNDMLAMEQSMYNRMHPTSMSSFSSSFGKFSLGPKQSSVDIVSSHKSFIAPEPGVQTLPPAPVESEFESSAVAADVPPNVPMFVEPNHYYSTMDPREIRANIQACLSQSDNVDFVLTMFTFVCTCYVRHAATEIWINIFNDDKSSVGPRSIIEIQRRSGDGYGFCEIVRSLKAYLQVHNVIALPDASASSKRSGWGAKAKAKAAAILAAAASAKSESSSTSSATKFVPACASHSEDGLVYRSLSGASVAAPISAPLQLPPMQVTAESVQASVQHMLSMAQPGGYEDVRAEALRTLADMSHEAMTRAALMSHTENLKTLLHCLADGAPDVHRLATTIIANLVAADARARASVLLMKGDEVMMARAAMTPVTQTIRESLRALRSLASSADDDASVASEAKATMRARKHLAPMLQRLAQHEQQRVREASAELEAMLA